MAKQSLLIIGAGAAGLMAAKKLSVYFDITILEARNRIGGRIHTINTDNEIVEAGAEFIHGNLPVTLKLLQEAGIKREAVAGEIYRKTRAGFVVENEMLAGWNDLLLKMKDVKRDITLHTFLQEYYKDNLHDELRKQLTAYAEGFDLADAEKVSVRYLYKEWSNEDETNYRIPQGYNSLTDYLLKKAKEYGCNLLVNKIVTRINWKENGVELYTNNNEVFKANKLLVTVPLNLLHNELAGSFIHFNPPVNAYRNASLDIIMGSALKVVVKFKKIFWPDDASFLLSDEKYFPTWWTQMQNINPTLTGWVGGKNAIEISSLSNDKILEIALASLSVICSIHIEQIKASIITANVFNWQADKISPGAYSYDTPQSAVARNIFRTPLLNTIFFAGEALYNGPHPGTVEAALVSGLHAAKQIKTSII